MKTGDTVRFLNATGGGVVSRIDEKKGLVFVEDADGFEVPALIREVVVIQNVNDDTNFPKKNFGREPERVKPEPQGAILPAMPPEPKPEPVVETAEGETLAVFLAFLPINIKQLQTTAYECRLVNDSNYFLLYNIVSSEQESGKSIAAGWIEPNTQEFLAEISKNDLNSWEHLQAQIIALKKDKVYTRQPVVDASIRLHAVKFYKLHSFTENDYFDDPAMLINLVSEKEKQMLSEISPEEIKEAILKKEQPGRKPRVIKLPRQQPVIEIDLHIHNLLDSTAGMSNADMLQYQMQKFHETLEEYKSRKGQKIVFIHGKGGGVLRKEIEKELKTKYKSFYFQDASFREYGFGATMVTIK